MFIPLAAGKLIPPTMILLSSESETSFPPPPPLSFPNFFFVLKSLVPFSGSFVLCKPFILE